MLKRTVSDNSKTEDTNGFEQWGGYMGAKKCKLEEQFRLESSAANILKSNIFNGTSIFVNGYTVPSANKLKLFMMEYGGVYHHYYTNEKTTYMIASNLPACKIKQLKNVKVIKPEWVTDSISAGKMLDHRMYLLYTDRNSDKFKANFNSCDNKDKLDTIVHKKNYITELSEGKDISSNNDNKDTNYINEEKVVTNHIDFVKRPTKTASDSDFLNEFYNNSRLHHISTMSTTFKDYVTSLRLKRNRVFNGRCRLKEWKNHNGIDNEEMDTCEGTIIMHIDMDCFFASVGVRNRPHLRGKPVAVTHAKGNRVSKKEGRDIQLEFNLYSEHREKLKSKKHEIIKSHQDDISKPAWFAEINEQDSMAEVACCNYEARKFGIKNGMLLGQALKLCPNLNTIPYDFEGYKEVSYALFDHVASFTLDIEAVSCDEMYVDVTEVLRYSETTPIQFATFIRSEIKEITGCPCSVGFGSNILLARLATKKAKPDGQFYIHQDNVKDFLSDFRVSDLPGVGHSTTCKLSLMGIDTCKDLQNSSVRSLQLEFGNKLGSTLYRHAHGEDDRKLTFDHQRKSVSADVNYGIRFQNRDECEDFLKRLSDEVANRLNNVGLKGKCITLKLMTRAKEAPAETAKFMGHGFCDYFTKSVTVPVSTSEASVILREVLRIIQNARVDVKEMRGIGIQVSKLDKMTRMNEKCIRLDRFLTNEKRSNSEIRETLPDIMYNNNNNNNNDNDNKIIDETSNFKQTAVRRNNIDFYLKTRTNPSVANGSKQDVNDFKVVAEKLPIIADAVSNEINTTNFEKDRTVSYVKSSAQLKCDDSYNNLSENGNTRIKSFSQNAASDSFLDDNCYIKELPSDHDDELVDRINKYPSKYVFVERNIVRLKSSVTLTEMKDAIREWMKDVTVPEACDVQILADYLQCKIYNRDLETIDILLKFVYRIVDEKNAKIWQKVYNDIVDEIQKTMLIVYGKTLMIKEIP